MPWKIWAASRQSILDGGGSSTFATQREGESENDTTAGLTLRCRPSDGYERKVSNTIMVLSTAKPQVSSTTRW